MAYGFDFLKLSLGLALSLSARSGLGYEVLKPTGQQLQHLSRALAFANALSGVNHSLKLSSGKCDFMKEAAVANTWFQLQQEAPQKFEEMQEQLKAMSLEEREKVVKSIRELGDKNKAIFQPQIDSFINRCGWPTVAEFGPNIGGTIALSIQHSDLNRQKQYFAVMVKAALAGQLKPEKIGLLVDRIRLRLGLPQIYGSQIVWDDTEAVEVVYKIEDERGVDERRRALGFYPVSWCAYLRLFELKKYPTTCSLDLIPSTAYPQTDKK